MNKVKNLLTFLAIICFNFCLAQNIILKDLTKENNSKIKFKGDWSLIGDLNNLEIFGESISNNDKGNSNNIIIEAFLVPTDTLISINSLPNKLINPLSVGKIPGNNSTDLNLKIKLNSDKFKGQTTNHKIVLALKDNKTNSIQDYKILELNQNTTSSNTKPNKQNTVKVSHDGPKSNFTIPKTASELVISGEWGIDVDFIDGEIEIFGKNNHVENLSTKPIEDLLLVVFLSPNKLKPNDENLSGYSLSSFYFKNIPARSKIENFKIKSNIDNIVPRGTYYASLILLQKNDEGLYSEVALVNFKEKVVLK